MCVCLRVYVCYREECEERDIELGLRGTWQSMVRGGKQGNWDRVYTHTYTNKHIYAKINNFIRCTDQFSQTFICLYFPFPFHNSYSPPCTPHLQSITAKDAHLSVQLQQQQQQCFAAEWRQVSNHPQEKKNQKIEGVSKLRKFCQTRRATKPCAKRRKAITTITQRAMRSVCACVCVFTCVHRSDGQRKLPTTDSWEPCTVWQSRKHVPFSISLSHCA